DRTAEYIRDRASGWRSGAELSVLRRDWSIPGGNCGFGPNCRAVAPVAGSASGFIRGYFFLFLRAADRSGKLTRSAATGRCSRGCLRTDQGGDGLLGSKAHGRKSQGLPPSRRGIDPAGRVLDCDRRFGCGGRAKIGPLAAAYVLFLAVLGPILTRAVK